MKNFVTIFNNYREAIQFGGFILLVALLPVTYEYLPYLMGLWVVGSVIAIRKHFPVDLSKNILAFLPALLFVLTFVSLLYSKNVNEGLSFMEKWISLLFILPAVLYLTKIVVLKKHLLLHIFISSNILVAVYCITIALSNSFDFTETGELLFETSYYDFLSDYSFFELIYTRHSHFSGGFFSQVHHPTYFAMYITFVIGILLYLIHKVKRIKRIIIFDIGILFFLGNIFILASRAGYITTTVLIVFSFVWFFHRKVKRRYIIIGSIVLLFAAGFLLMKTRLGNNMRQVVALVFDEEVPKEKLDARLLLWNVGLDLARESPIWGYGVGDVHDKLEELYEERGMEKALAQHFNVHNQYLSVYLATGVFGLAALLYWFFGSLILGIRTGNYLLSVFMLIIIINALFENILDRSAGLAFILLFYPILMHQSLQKKRNET